MLQGTLEQGGRGSKAGLPLTSWVICKTLTPSAFTERPHEDNEDNHRNYLLRED